MLSTIAAGLVTILLAGSQSVGSRNLLINPGAEEDTAGWTLSPSDASIEACGGRNRCFVVHDRGRWIQEVALPPGPGGQVVVLIGFAQADRTERAAGITDRPYLYGQVRSADGSLLKVLQRGGRDLHTADSSSAWQLLYAIHDLPPGADHVLFQLALAARIDIPSTRAAGRFDDVGLFVFASRPDAEAFVRSYQRGR